MMSMNLDVDTAVRKLAAESRIPVSSPVLTDVAFAKNAKVNQKPEEAPKRSGDMPLDQQPLIMNDTCFSDQDLQSVLGTAARLLAHGQKPVAASILTNAGGKLTHHDHDSWNGGSEIWRLTLSIPAEVFVDLSGRDQIERDINEALSTAIQVISESDVFLVRLAPSPEQDPNWRQKVRQHLSGEGITNQGRVRSDNIAAREHDGLLFRSKQEIHFYNALKSTGLPFAPLSVVLQGGMTYRRVEPDFVIYKDGIAMLVEVDGDAIHTETPAAAHARLKFITDEGLRLERISASECDSAQKAREAVQRIVATMDKLRNAR